MFLVRIEFARVQTFLFAVPRLADILGANILLGEVLRVHLRELARDKTHPSLNLLPAKIPADLPHASEDDPLYLSLPDATDPDQDSPAALYGEGILTRDGGHFSALFVEKEAADAFARSAAAEIRSKLPGLRFEIPDPLPLLTLPEASKSAAKVGGSMGIFAPGLPLLQICEDSGRNPAVVQWRYNRDETRSVSLPVWQRKNRSRDFNTGSGKPTRDIASLLSNGILFATAGDQARMRIPGSFDELCGDEYLALIHADGNGVGAWSARVRDFAKTVGEDCLGKYLNREAAGEQVFHAIRVSVRKAVVAAAQKVFGRKDVAPYRILMLGGDDVLLACRASLALNFVQEYASALSLTKLPDVNEDGQSFTRPLGAGIGVAIAKPGFPFHRLHEMAASLAGSAKRLTRTSPEISAVDWLICTETWLGDIAEVRAREAVRRHGAETLVLCGKPYPALKTQAGESGLSLEALLESEKQLAAAPRSQRRWLANEVERGRRHAELCLAELRRASPQAFNAFESCGLVERNGQSGLWRQGGDNVYLTILRDLVEITEIRNLRCGGEQRSGDDHSPGAEAETEESQA